jgi:hypothetical protein
LSLYTPDYKKLLMVGDDVFSCDWKDKRVLVNVNYRETDKADGVLVSMEVQ